VGSLPTAFLLVRRKAGIDIRASGSGNVGGYNAYYVTRSRLVGLLVILLDVLKGWLPVVGVGLLSGGDFWIQATALGGVLIGHNYPVWLAFKGGRGLASAAGGLFGLGVSYMIVWILVWTASYWQRRDILRGNVFAIVATPLVIFLLPSSWIEATMIARASVSDYRLFSLILSLIHLLSHHDAVRSIVRHH